ncbi:Bacitracin export ATP-binding protein BceA [Clostridium haemolyticum]|uniref:ABC transporter ATP-binding protein n=1 Tax=Clostridium TaxID=1485 RepID=UPI00057EB7A9|nr:MULTISPECIES: ABC transporter ATP-binding protein [Clostridium]AYF55296.1 ABC transporter ATP-binding protein [Clostridium novyi]CAG7838739.1 Bacitracin export ATP-binding protein BceA [Clostridium haemolyticum]
MRNVLEVKNIKKDYINNKYKYTILNGLTFNIQEGEFVAIMGSSGSGKTTLLNVISTIDEVTSGYITINGKNINNMTEDEKSEFRRKYLGFIFQEYNLINTLTLKENIQLILSVNNYNIHDIDSKVLKIAKYLNIDKILNKYPYEVSGGERQRCACARALILNPNIILADEPTGALDSNSSKKLLEIMKKINKNNNISILMVTHDPIVASYCSRVIFIKDGILYKDIHNDNYNIKDFHKEIVRIMTTLGDETYENHA